MNTTMAAADLIVRFAEAEEAAQVSRGARVEHERVVLRLAAHAGARSVLDLDGDEVSAWVRGLGVGAQRRRALVAGLHAFYAWTTREGLTTTDPSLGLSTPRLGLRSPVGDELADMLAGWRVAQERRRLAPSTVYSRRNGLRLFGQWLGGRSVLVADADDIERWLDTRNLGPRARYRAVSDLFAFYRWAMRQGFTDTNPAADIDRPKVRVGVPRPISDDDLSTVLASAPQPLRTMFALAAYEGLRCQEIAGVQRADVLDCNAPPLLRVTKGKGGKERLLPLHPVVGRLVNDGALPRSGYLFTAKGSRRPLKPEYLGPLCNDYLRSIGVDATMHQLRHWFGSSLYARTKDLRMVQEMLGHSSPTTTAVYAAFNPGEAVGAVCGLSVDRAS